MSGVSVLKAAIIPALLLVGGSAQAALPEDLPDPPAPGTLFGAAPPPPSSPASPPSADAPPKAPPSPAAPPSFEDKLLPLPHPSPAAGPQIELPPASPAAGADGAPPADADEVGSGRRLTIGGYGEAQLFSGLHGQDKEAKLRRFVLFLGHRFNDWIRLYSETEVEDGTQIEMEQAYVELAPEPWLGVRVGLQLVPLGIVNQLHEPPTILSVDRPLTDQLIIPSTWRELGVGLYGDLGAGLRYQVAAMTGLDPTGFSAEAPLFGARGDGRSVDVHDPAFAGRLDFAGVVGLDVGAGGYVGWARGGHPELDGVRVGVVEGDARYHHAGLDVRAEYAHLFVVDSYRLNDYFGLTGSEQIPARGRGFYLQAGYDLFRLLMPQLSQELYFYAAYENVNPRSRMSPYNLNPPSITGANETPPNGASPAKDFVRIGFSYRPHPQVALKIDAQFALHTDVPAAAIVAPGAGALGVLQPLDADVAAAAKGESRLGLGAAFMF
jgi:hypothetical protein